MIMMDVDDEEEKRKSIQTRRGACFGENGPPPGGLGWQGCGNAELATGRIP